MLGGASGSSPATRTVVTRGAALTYLSALAGLAGRHTEQGYYDIDRLNPRNDSMTAQNRLRFLDPELGGAANKYYEWCVPCT